MALTKGTGGGGGGYQRGLLRWKTGQCHRTYTPEGNSPGSCCKKGYFDVGFLDRKIVPPLRKYPSK